jgi:hypothetical protein
MPRIAITLVLSDGAETTVRVPTNRLGQLPAVVVDPRDDGGSILPGMWLGESRDRQPDGTRYQWVKND